MERFDRLTGDGLHPVEAMRRVTPFLDSPPARSGEHVARAALSAATASTSASTAPPPGSQQHADTVPTVRVDTHSSASRQHYIDTGQYLSAGEAARTGASQRDDDTEPTAVADAVDERAHTTGDLDRSTGVRCGQPLAAGSALEPATLGDAARDSHCRSAADLAKDGFPEPLTAEVLAAGRVRPKAPATTAPAAVRSAGLATAARAASRTR
jgi:hypothetical protein